MKYLLIAVFGLAGFLAGPGVFLAADKYNRAVLCFESSRENRRSMDEFNAQMKSLCDRAIRRGARERFYPDFGCYSLDTERGKELAQMFKDNPKMWDVWPR